MADTYMAVGSGDERNGEEHALLTKLSRVRENSANYFAVHIHLSALRETNRQPYFISIAKRSFESFLDENDAQLFAVFTGDLVLVCRLTSVDVVDGVIDKVRAMFPEDPLTKSQSGSYDDKFVTWHDLSMHDELQAFTDLADEIARAAKEAIENNKSDMHGQVQNANLGKPLVPENLSAINQQMKRTQIADLIRNQSICRVIPGEKGEIIFSEYFIAMAGLKERVAPGVNLFSSPWLFQYLTETLDKRMLAVIGKRNMDEISEAISLNLNIATIMSRDFQQFNDLVGENTGKFIIEFQMIDIFSDMGAYSYARDFLHEAGYQVLVDGLNPLIINFFDPSMLLSDMMKINWGPEYSGEENGEAIEDVRTVVKHAGNERLILARVDSYDAVRWGASLGITRFQGYYVDKLVLALRARKGRS